MLYKGAELKPNNTTIVIPRQSGDIVITAQPVTNYDDFIKLCPQPVAPMIRKPNGSTYHNVEDPTYKKQMDEWGVKRVDWMILKSLEATPDIVFQTVNIADPDTWINYRTELIEAGFSILEINKIFDTVTYACGLNQDKIDEATKSFLAGQGSQLNEQSSPNIELNGMQNGEPVNG